MITYLYVNNYKSLVNFRIEFDRVNLVLGKNGTGKSSVFHILLQLRGFINGFIRTSDVFSPTSLTRWMKSMVQVFEFGMEIGEKRYIYHLEIEHEEKMSGCHVLAESVKCNDKIIFERNDTYTNWYNNEYTVGQNLRVDPTVSGLGIVFDVQTYSVLFQFKKSFSEILFFSPNPKIMSNRYERDTAYPNVELSDIVSVYATLQQTQMKNALELQNCMKQINPAFEEANMNFDMYGKTLEMNFRYLETSVSVNFSEISEGERMVFSLYLVLIAYIKQGYSVFIDEPDNFVSLHEIQPWCRGVEEACLSDGQCVIISHNAEVIDYFAGDCGIWMNRLRSGESVVENNPFAIPKYGEFLKYSELIAGGYNEVQ